MAFLETMLQVLIILPFLCPTKKLLWKLVPIGDVVSVHEKHVMNTVPTLSIRVCGSAGLPSALNSPQPQVDC